MTKRGLPSVQDHPPHQSEHHLSLQGALTSSSVIAAHNLNQAQCPLPLPSSFQEPFANLRQSYQLLFWRSWAAWYLVWVRTKPVVLHQTSRIVYSSIWRSIHHPHGLAAEYPNAATIGSCLNIAGRIRSHNFGNDASDL